MSTPPVDTVTDFLARGGKIRRVGARRSRRPARVKARPMPVAEPLTAEDEAALAARPRTRGECATGPRPCPFAGCRHHLGLDVSWTGRRVIEREVTETCSLDLAERGGMTLDAVAEVLGLTRERVRQIEDMGLDAMDALVRRLELRP